MSYADTVAIRAHVVVESRDILASPREPSVAIRAHVSSFKGVSHAQSSAMSCGSSSGLSATTTHLHRKTNKENKMTMQEIVVMKDSEFQQAREQLKKIVSEVRLRGCEAAKLLARMSNPQLQIVKQDFRGIWSSDQIERLAMCGRGEIDTWLALKQKSLPASVLRRLPDEAIKVLNDPDSDVELLTQRGVKVRKVGTLSSVELSQITDAKKGILKAEDQAKKIMLPPKEMPTDDLEDAQSIKLSEDRKFLLVKAQHVTVRIPMKTLRRFVA